MTDEDESKLGEAVSERIRLRYGVVQDPAVHKYVTLVGGVLAQASTRPGLHWRFIVLDTDGVNALAAPGGLVHITRGALSLMTNEAELADVLGHEMIHVTEKHTIKAIQKGKTCRSGLTRPLGQRGALQRARGQGHGGRRWPASAAPRSSRPTKRGSSLANTVGYDLRGSALPDDADRAEQASTEKQGLFASHPEMQERLEKLDEAIKAGKLTAAVTVGAALRGKRHLQAGPR